MSCVKPATLAGRDLGAGFACSVMVPRDPQGVPRRRRHIPDVVTGDCKRTGDLRPAAKSDQNATMTGLENGENLLSLTDVLETFNTTYFPVASTTLSIVAPQTGNVGQLVAQTRDLGSLTVINESMWSLAHSSTAAAAAP
jgi:hypothetical protein